MKKVLSLCLFMFGVFIFFVSNIREEKIMENLDYSTVTYVDLTETSGYLNNATVIDDYKFLKMLEIVMVKTP